MRILPIPDLMADSIYSFTPETFRSLGVKLILLDVDNTLSPYGFNGATEEQRTWVADMKAAGIETILLSNNHGQRPAFFASHLGVEYVGKAWKPFARAIKRILAKKGIMPSSAVVVGDQIYTDVLSAKAAGCRSALVKPIALHNPLLAVRYFLELPFRLACKKKL